MTRRLIAAAVPALILSGCGPGLLTWTLSGYGVNSTLSWDTRCRIDANRPANGEPETPACETLPDER